MSKNLSELSLSELQDMHHRAQEHAIMWVQEAFPTTWQVSHDDAQRAAQFFTIAHGLESLIASKMIEQETV